MIRRLVRLGRQMFFRASEYAGISALIAASEWRRDRLLILCYHGVSLIDEHLWDPELFVTREFLRDRMQLLRNTNCSILPLGEAVERLASGNLPPKSVAVTFDDGFFNFAVAAAPILTEFDIPAMVYVSSYHCVNQRPLLRLAIRYLLWKARDRPLSVDAIRGLASPARLSFVGERERAAEQLYRDAHSRCVNNGDQQEYLESLAGLLGLNWREFCRGRQFHLMNIDELRQVSAQGFDIELHTHRHRTPRDRKLFDWEVSENSRIILAATRKAPRHFCYPSGDYDFSYVRWLQSAGIKSATTCEVGLATPESHALLLPRFIDTMAQSRAAFLGWVSGVAEFVSTSRPTTAAIVTTRSGS